MRAAGTSALLWLAAILVFVVAPGGPVAALRYWTAGVDERAEVAGISADADPTVARVGDLVLRYRYPDYTGLEPKVVPNSTGDAQGPPGTQVEVTARTADPIESGALVAYDETLEAAVAADARGLTGTFAIRPGEGSYNLLLVRSGLTEPSREFAITAVDDLAPDVSVDAGTDSDILEVAADQPIDLLWRARDDYGVRVVVPSIDGRDLDIVLERPLTRQAEVSGVASLTPAELGLSPGDRAALTIVAWDNDTVSGSKAGSSRPIRIVVLGAEGMDLQRDERRAALIEVMLPLLASFLVEPWPAADTSGGLAAWGEEVARRYEPTTEVAFERWAGMSTHTLDRRLVERVLDTGRELVRYTQVSFVPDATDVPSNDSFTMLGQLRDAAIVAVEDAIYAFHKLRMFDAEDEIRERADDLTKLAARLDELPSPPELSAAELASQLDRVARMNEVTAETAKRLDDGLREFTEQRLSEAGGLEEEIREAMAKRDLEEARRLTDRLARLAEETGDGIREELERRSRRANDLEQEMRDVIGELRQLEAEQRGLQSDVQALREEDPATAKRMADLWGVLEEKTAAHRAMADSYVRGLDDADRPFFERERAAVAAEDAADLDAAVAARDLHGALMAADNERVGWAIAESAWLHEVRRRGVARGPGGRELEVLSAQLTEIERLLAALESAQSATDPRMVERSAELAGQQRDLEARLEDTEAAANQLARQYPVRPEGMAEALDDAGERKGQASADLSRGRPMQAEGSQGVAAQRIHDAIEALLQAQAQGQAMAGDPQLGDPRAGDPVNAETDDGTRVSKDDLDIPGREEFRTPEEYRKALLEGMEGEVPEEYRAMKRRYYEELVLQ